VGFAAGSLSGIGQGISVWSPTAKAPRVEQYSVDIQRELPGGIALSLGYVGTRGTHLPMDLNQNVLNPTYFSMGHAALNTKVANPFYGTPAGVGVVGTQTVPDYQLLLPYVTYGGVTFSSNSINHSIYHSLVAKAQKRMSYGLTFLTQVTWEKMEDYNSGGNQQNAFYNFQGEWSLSQYSPPVLYSVSFTYELPAGRGRHFLNNNPALDYLLGGWSLNGTGVYRSGFPLAFGQTQNLNGAYGFGQRPNSTGAAPQTSGSLESRLNNYINPAAFAADTTEFTFGNLSRYIPMYGPGVAHWDMSLFKTVSFKEAFRVQFRAEALNAFNTPMFNGPNTTVGSGSFGLITSQADLSRQFQLCLRFIW